MSPTRRSRTVLTAAGLSAALAGLSGCTSGLPVSTAPMSTAPMSTAPTTSVSPSASAAPPVARTPRTAVRTTPRAAGPFDVGAVLSRIQALAAIGPRDAVTANYAEAATSVSIQLAALGYRVTRQRFSVPAGVSWGFRVAGGTSTNVVADPPDFDPARPHVVIGAHLDTVPQAPGAEDNASGVSVMVELALMLRQQPAGLPVRLVAFGAEEARGGNGTLYAFGSRHFVGLLSAAQRQAVVGMVALDRVGVRGATVPVCSGGRGSSARAAAIRSAARTGVTNGCTNRASDHVSFEAAGIPAARLGSVPYAAYHSARDVPRLIDPVQIGRVGQVLWVWLRTLRA